VSTRVSRGECPIHVGQRQAFPSFWDRMSAWRGFEPRMDDEFPALPVFTKPYHEQLGEAQAADVTYDAMVQPPTRRR